jgi:hypothetical protein
MDDRVGKLQLRIRALRRDHAASQVRYPENLRAEIRAVARAGRAAGRSMTSLARELGVSAPTLIQWVRQPARRPWRPVTVAPPSASEAPPMRPVLVTPHGFRVEGLDVAGVVAVLQSLA